MSVFLKKPSNEPEENNNREKDDVKKDWKDSDAFFVFKWLIPVLIPMVVFFVMMMIDSIVTKPNATKLAQQNAQIVELKNKIDIQQNQYKDMQAQELVFEEHSYYNGNTDEDDQVAEKFFSHICTWEDSTTYEELRNEMLEAGYTEEDSLMRALLPAQSIYFSKEDQQWHSATDENGDNMKFESLTTYPISNDDKKHEYAGILKVSSKDRTSGGMNREYFGHVYVRYIIENQKCISVTAEALVDQ